MTIFKTFLKVLNKCKGPIILYTFILIFFGAFNFKNSDNNLNFISSKPDLLIINQDQEEGITKSLIAYLTKNSNIVEIEDTEEARNDALFYRDVNYIVYIPENFNEDFLDGKNPKIDIKSTGDYNASYAEMLLTKYLKVASVYLKNNYSVHEIVAKTEETLNEEVEIKLNSHLDTNNLNKATTYFNFLSYSMLAGCIYVICLILSSFKEKNVNKRTIISSMNYQKYNRILLLSNILFALILWIIYIVLSIILIGNIMFTSWGFLYLLNSFIFTLCCVALAFLISNLVKNKEAINGIINVIALGSSFLCGAFVPMEWLPNSVLSVAHLLQSYWFIKSNELIKTLETINLLSLQPILINLFVLIIFALLFIVLSNFVYKKKRRVG